MDWFRWFASEGLHAQVFAVAWGSALILIAPYRKRPTAEEIESAHPAIRWLLRYPWEKWGGWTMLIFSAGVAALTLAA